MVDCVFVASDTIVLLVGKSVVDVEIDCVADMLEKWRRESEDDEGDGEEWNDKPTNDRLTVVNGRSEEGSRNERWHMLIMDILFSSWILRMVKNDWRNGRNNEQIKENLNKKIWTVEEF